MKASSTAVCPDLKPLERLNYFYGQMLGVRELQTEQRYFLERLRLHNRCLHGHGVVCGLEVTPSPPDEECLPAGYTPPAPAPDPRQQIAELEKKLEAARNANDHAAVARLEQEIETQKRQTASTGPHPVPPAVRACIRINCGIALDCCGHELIVNRAINVDVWALLSAEDRRGLNPDGETLYLSLCYCQQMVGPVRPVYPDPCAQPGECLYGYVRDAYRVQLTRTAPAHDTRCEPCCDPCDDCCVLIARIDRFRHGAAIDPGDIRIDVRRRMALYDTSTITGLSFKHGAAYAPDEARQILGRGTQGGVEIRFSKKVRAETLLPGVIDVWVVEGGPGRSAPIYNKAGELEFTPDADGFTDRVVFRDKTREALQDQDRVILIVRCAFILDACCWPVAGFHIGGRVPLLPGYEQFDKPHPYAACETPPWGYAPWTADPTTRGADFIAWFWVTDPESPKGGGTGQQARVK